MAERHVTAGIDATRVRSTMFEIGCYCLGDCRTRSVTANSYFAGYSTHIVFGNLFAVMGRRRDNIKKARRRGCRNSPFLMRQPANPDFVRKNCARIAAAKNALKTKAEQTSCKGRGAPA